MTRICESTLFILLAAIACSGADVGSTHGDGDAVRDRAKAIFIDRSVTDRIETNRDDFVDWKYVDVVDQGELRLTVSVDQPERLDNGEVHFYDEFGNRLDRSRVVPEQTVYVHTTDVQKVPNKFFVKVVAQGGRSVYTVGAALKPPPAPPEVVPAPVVIAPPPPSPKPRNRHTRRKSPKPTVIAPPPPPPPQPAAPAHVTGKVIRVIPADDRNKSVNISVKLPAGANVSKGARGSVFKNGEHLGALKVFQVSGRTAHARVNVPPGKFSGNLTVRIEIN